MFRAFATDFCVASWQDGEKFLAAVAADGVVIPQRIRQMFRDLAEGCIAGGMPETVVNSFEMIDVREDDGHTPDALVPPASLQFTLQQF